MKKFSLLLSMGVLVATSFFIGCTENNTAVENDTQLNRLLAKGNDSAVHWGYDEHAGPDQWCLISHEYELCCEGVSQSPIDIVKSAMVEDENLPKLKFKYKKVPLTVFNNGHTVQASLPAESNVTLKIGKKKYRLLQFHFHTASENLVEGHEFPMEMHLVHQSENGALAVAGVFLVEGDKHKQLNKIFKDLPAHEGDYYEVNKFNLSSLLPEENETFRWTGSLTTPPCSEGVSWNVFVEPLELSTKQINNFKQIFSGTHFPDGNRRPVLPLNGRIIYTDTEID